MQAMQDKDFDQLFKDKFEDAEIRPSTNLWSNIEKELTPKKKRVFPVYWAAAAAVALIAVSVGLLSRETEKMQLQGARVASVLKSNATVNHELTTASTIGATSGTNASNVAPSPSVVPASEEGAELVLAPKVKLRNLVQENNLANVQPDEKIKRHQLKPVEVYSANALEGEVKPILDLPNENVIANVALPDVQNGDQVITETEGKEERKGIRNVGDVINFVVDKLDKRDKKLIQFKTDDDDNSSLIAVNIGILKFNPKRNR
ncbi:hypothetical protein [Pedobacter gandavensis]|uniref:Uncharacterized protein n=1 Tax=Pedobacter gandavensis TaxID=2679963 RepID=A0ABR6F437_9SPHI|nr:hypothetical protein [Pedobacter gandavensis]MBB2151784.1 hypothetical protein [Pedobacter gandavensis]